MSKAPREGMARIPPQGSASRSAPLSLSALLKMRRGNKGKWEGTSWRLARIKEEEKNMQTKIP